MTMFVDLNELDIVMERVHIVKALVYILCVTSTDNTRSEGATSVFKNNIEFGKP